SSEINLLKMINHTNIIRLSGYCIHQGNTYLVYEYAYNGSLSDWLRSKKNQSSLTLSWKQRVQIAYDVGDAINYLHNFTNPPYIHKNLKTSNILLDGNFRAKLANFGLARMVENDDQGGVHMTRHVVGTHGYMAPEYIENGVVTPKLDVFGFGVVVLELLSGREAAAIDKKAGEQLLSAAVIRVLEGDNVREKLRGFIDPSLKNEYPLDLAFSMAQQAKLCVVDDPNARPAMSEILVTLSKILSSTLDWDPSDEFNCSSGSEPTRIASLNNISSDVATISTNTQVVVPVNCSCSGDYFQHNASYTLKDTSENYFTVANDTYQGLTTCQAMIAQNPYNARNLSVVCKSWSLTLYKFHDLQMATGYFGEANIIKGSFYRGSFKGDTAAVKVMKGDVSSEINLLKMINHSNVIRLSGFCVHQRNTYLYEYADNSSLSDWLCSNRNQSSLTLSWKQRIQIAYNVADAINYLHNFTNPPYIHKNLKTSNILLDGNFRAKLANFLARMVENDDHGLHLTRHVVSTRGNIDPYLENGVVTPKLDVFGFGVVILELLSGREAAAGDKKAGEELLFAPVSRVLKGDNVREKLRGFIDHSLRNEYPLKLAISIAQLAKLCCR
ncbi:LOW QUALITY PROTEIN: Pkinase domain-containing protein/Pkinase_Tyr domain-containing protein, partial [Cephalotus follicularis]